MIFQAKELLNRMGSRQEKGQGLIEYALILLLVAIVVIVILSTLGDQINAVFQSIINTLQAKLPTTP
jgi:pilus assembly protein Flp/PilA